MLFRHLKIYQKLIHSLSDLHLLYEYISIIPKTTGIYRIAKSAVLVVPILILGGCGSVTSSHDASPPALTVLDKQSEQPDRSTVMLSSLDKLPDVYGRSWLSANELIIDRDNQLIIYNTDTRTEKPLTPERTGVQLLAEVSPDGKHVYFTEGSPDNRDIVNGYILDRSTDHITPIENIGFANEIQWADESHLISAVTDEGIRIFDLNGHATLLQIDQAAAGLMHAEQLNDTIYYVSSGSLYKVDPNVLQITKVASNVLDYAIAPDGQSIVIQQVKWNTAEPFKLVIIHPDGDVLGTIGEGTLLSRPAWSPDGQMLAFSIYQESQQGLKGLYVFNQQTGQTTPLVPEFQAYNSSLKWNPDSTKLSLYNEEQSVVTAIIGIDH